MRILIIEDTKTKMEEIVKALRRVLNDPSIDTAATRNEGLCEYRSALDSDKPYDVVITDNIMPIMTGTRPEPLAEDVLTEIDRLRKVHNINNDCIKIVCSSDRGFQTKDYTGKYDFVYYDFSTLLDGRLKEILNVN